MRNKRLILLSLICSVLLSACGSSSTHPDANTAQTPNAASASVPTQVPAVMESTESTQIENEGETELKLLIGETEVAVQWEDNESVAALRELAADEPLTIAMSMYGGFEQVGSIGTNLPRDDVQIVTEAGDIVLYGGNQIVIFYGSNSWAYTRLGKVMDLTLQELTDRLGNGNISLTIFCE